MRAKSYRVLDSLLQKHKIIFFTTSNSYKFQSYFLRINERCFDVYNDIEYFELIKVYLNIFSYFLRKATLFIFIQQLYSYI